MNNYVMFHKCTSTLYSLTRTCVKLFRSDKGTHFVGTVDDLGVNAINVEYTC